MHRALASILLMGVAVTVLAQERSLPLAQERPLPRPFGSGGVSGQVLDAVSGRPIDGVIVVARWNWEEFHPAYWERSAGFDDHGEVLAIHEVVTDANGRFHTPAWGPIVRGNGRLQFDAPSVFLFKSGYEPLTVTGNAAGDTIRLRAASGPAEDLAKRIADMQVRRDPRFRAPAGLHWQDDTDVWKAMPRMIHALHREKIRLGAAGRYVLGANLLHNRSGVAKLVMPGLDQRASRNDGTRIWPAVVNVTWQIRSDDGRATRRIVEQKLAWAKSESIFWVSPWRFPQPGPPGWSADVDSAPLVHVYAANYRASADVRWEETGGTVVLEPLAETREARLGELRRWRRDIDDELVKGDPADALEGQRVLIWLLVQECRRLTIDAREGICRDEDAEIARPMEREASLKGLVTEDELGGTDLGYAPQQGSGAAIGAQSVPLQIPPDKKPVSGFSIAPAGK